MFDFRPGLHTDVAAMTNRLKDSPIFLSTKPKHETPQPGCIGDKALAKVTENRPPKWSDGLVINDSLQVCRHAWSANDQAFCCQRYPGLPLGAVDADLPGQGP